MMATAEFYTYDEAREHKRLWSGVWSSVIWVDAADGIDLAVIHWMGGGYKVVGRYRSQERDGIEHAKAHDGRYLISQSDWRNKDNWSNHMAS